MEKFQDNTFNRTQTFLSAPKNASLKKKKCFRQVSFLFWFPLCMTMFPSRKYLSLSSLFYIMHAYMYILSLYLECVCVCVSVVDFYNPTFFLDDLCTQRLFWLGLSVFFPCGLSQNLIALNLGRLASRLSRRVYKLGHGEKYKPRLVASFPIFTRPNNNDILVCPQWISSFIIRKDFLSRAACVFYLAQKSKNLRRPQSCLFIARFIPLPVATTHISYTNGFNSESAILICCSMATLNKEFPSCLPDLCDDLKSQFRTNWWHFNEI